MYACTMTADVLIFSLPSEHFPVLTTSASHPMMLLSPEGLLMLVPPSKVDQEAIVSKVKKPGMALIHVNHIQVHL